MGAWDTLAREREEAVAVAGDVLRERDLLRTEVSKLRSAIDFAIAWVDAGNTAESAIDHLRRAHPA